MKIDRDMWRSEWDEGNYPSLPCPRCAAPLNFDQSSLVVQTPNHNRWLFDEGHFESARSRFSAWLVCAHSKCGETVAVLGNCTYSHDYDKSGKAIVERTFHPKAMHPGPSVISVSSDVPELIRNALRASFGLLWCSHEACAARLRVVLELMLAEWGFPAKSDSGKFISLHQRITDWHSLYGADGIATSLMAIKWLGNVGSHDSRLSRARLLDAYEILARLLRQLFPQDERYLDKLANEIVNSKGRMS